MADKLHARQGDTLDGLLFRERGLVAAALPAVLAANPGLARLGPILPLGTAVVVPPAAIEATATRDVVSLWD
ncbi:tail protein X [Sphingomonas sp.]|uniref:tail protein X n=1 Tax=Sphingomonas sp. TaxID=28214 RepID=UPI002EDA7632